MRQCQNNDTLFVFLDQGLHRTPNKLRERVQREIDRTSDTDECFILLGYGLCGNGTVGVQARANPLVLPAVHDCISLFLGSVERYREEFRKESGTYFLSPGWIEEGDTLLHLHEQCKKKYGAETADWIIEEEFKNYQRIALIDTKVCPIQKFRDESKRNAKFLNLKYEEIPGSLAFFEKFLSGDWDHDFLLIEKGQKVTQDMFMSRIQ